MARMPVHQQLSDVLSRFAPNWVRRWWIESFLACRAVLFIGNRFTCPCCGWHLRMFVGGVTSFKRRPNGYCPRCNSKARHRRDWLFLQDNTNLFHDRLRLLHVSPKYALSRRLTKMRNVEFVGVDLVLRPNVNEIVDITDIPYGNDTFDCIICIHVLEHVEDDRRAIGELYRVLKPGGWALISVPVRLDQGTVEDPTVVSPAERKRLFGEKRHVRFYGRDLVDRLQASGFSVRLDRAESLEPDRVDKYGLLQDENVFFCSKA